MNTINFSELALALRAASINKHPLGELKVTVNHRPVIGLDVMRNADGTAFSLTMIVQRLNDVEGRGPQRVRLPASRWIRTQGNSVTYRQVGRGNYTFNFYDARTGEHMVPETVVATFRRADDSQLQAA